MRKGIAATGFLLLSAGFLIASLKFSNLIDSVSDFLPVGGSGSEVVEISQLASPMGMSVVGSSASAIPREPDLVPNGSIRTAVEDSFDTQSETFLLGEGSVIRDGALFLGPFEECANDVPNFDNPVNCGAVCLTCGAEVSNYVLEVEFAFEEGVSDRIFGVMLRFHDVNGDSLLDREDYLLALGFNTFTGMWHVYVHAADQLYPWYLVKRGPAGLRIPGKPNRLEATASNAGRLFEVTLNESRIFTLTADAPRPGETYVQDWVDQGGVGFIALGRRVTGRYDHFRFEPRP